MNILMEKNIIMGVGFMIVLGTVNFQVDQYYLQNHYPS